VNEVTPRAALVRQLAEGTSLVVLRHEDMYTAGHPDISVTGRGRTLWIEVKWLRLDWKNKLQRETCRRLEQSGLFFVLTYTLEGVSVMRSDGSVIRTMLGRGPDLQRQVVSYVRLTLMRGEVA
jgi:hypothetical protein